MRKRITALLAAALLLGGLCAPAAAQAQESTLTISTPEQLQQLRTALEQPAPRWEHIGIYNVAARLRLLDARCRVVVRSRPGRGTAVILYLPLVENEEEFEE